MSSHQSVETRALRRGTLHRPPRIRSASRLPHRAPRYVGRLAVAAELLDIGMATAAKQGVDEAQPRF